MTGKTDNTSNGQCNSYRGSHISCMGRDKPPGHTIDTTDIHTSSQFKHGWFNSISIYPSYNTTKHAYSFSS